MFGKASAHLSEELRQGWRSLKILCRFGSMGSYVTTKGILFTSCGSLLSLSASSLEVDVAFLLHLLCILSCIPIVGNGFTFLRRAFEREFHWSIFFVDVGQGCKEG